MFSKVNLGSMIIRKFNVDPKKQILIETKNIELQWDYNYFNRTLMPRILAPFKVIMLEFRHGECTIIFI